MSIAEVEGGVRAGTETATVSDPVHDRPRSHPLAPLTPLEIDALRTVVEDAGLGGPTVRYSYVSVREPHKDDLAAAADPCALPREVEAVLIDLDTAVVRDVVVDLDAARIVANRVVDTATEGTIPSLDDVFEIADRVVKADAGWRQALADRGITDLDKVCTVALSAGSFGFEDEVGIRAARVLAFWQEYPTDSVWAHPVDGVVARVDITNERVLKVITTDVTHVPQESGDYLDPEVRGPERTTLRPIHITQPEGVSFTLEDGVLEWQNWSVRVGFNGREGLTLHDLKFTDTDHRTGTSRVRPVLHRASISEMVVNYGDPTPTHSWQNYFDVGEYQFGRLANPLELGCDCLGEITYVDAVVADDHGRPRAIPNAICIHEEDYGILWKHTDAFSGSSETRRQRRLVISFFVTVGNYDYGFYWHLYLDGTIQLESKATGIVFTSGHPGGDYPYATELAPGLGAPVHQHMFCARLDMTVDGHRNAVDEIDTAAVVAMGPDNPVGNAIGRTITRFSTELDAVRDADNGKGRVWRISSTEHTNRLGENTSFVLYPEGQPTLLAAPGSSVQERAGFAAHHLWVSRYDRDEMWASGRLVNQNPGGNGLPSYVQADRDIDGQDIVVWHTFGLTHFPRTEDWPIMPVDYTGFKLKPHGFFDRNPTLDVPANRSAHGADQAPSCH
ncbi:primary-amine oxidase [Kineococcus sp. SYSU DK001]|uniref:primary-amine oxidase n=1 Tax=Kineococcus sp. SYSU DK001 TaxID=3383122 RepID=UPI003D7D2EAA